MMIVRIFLLANAVYDFACAAALANAHPIVRPMRVFHASVLAAPRDLEPSLHQAVAASVAVHGVLRAAAALAPVHFALLAPASYLAEAAGAAVLACTGFALPAPAAALVASCLFLAYATRPALYAPASKAHPAMM